MDILEQLKVIVVGFRVARVLSLFTLLQFISHSALNFGYVQYIRLVMSENIVFLMNDFRSIDIIPLECLEKSLVKFGLVYGLERSKLEVWIFLRERAQLPSLDNPTPALQRGDIDRAIDNFRHLFDFLLELIVWV